MDRALTLSPNEAQVLSTLLRIDTPVTGRAVARITDLTQSSAQRALVGLRDAGLVLIQPASPALLYRPNLDHLAIPALRALFQLDDELRHRMAEHIAGWQLKPLSVVVYGSVARGQAMVNSDIDVLVVRSDTIEPDDAHWQRQVADLANCLQAWTGRPASVIDMSHNEIGHGLAAQEPFLLEADREGWLIAGPALHQLIQ